MRHPRTLLPGVLLTGALLTGCSTGETVVVGVAGLDQAEESPAEPTAAQAPSTGTASPGSAPAAPSEAANSVPPSPAGPAAPAQPTSQAGSAPAAQACSAEAAGVSLGTGGASARAVETAQDLLTAALACDSQFLITLATQDRPVLGLEPARTARPGQVFALPDADQRYLALARTLSATPASADDEWIWPAAAAGDGHRGYQVSISTDGKWVAFYRS